MAFLNKLQLLDINLSHNYLNTSEYNLEYLGDIIEKL